MEYEKPFIVDGEVQVNLTWEQVVQFVPADTLNSAIAQAKVAALSQHILKESESDGTND